MKLSLDSCRILGLVFWVLMLGSVASAQNHFASLNRVPDAVRILTDTGWADAVVADGGRWDSAGISVFTESKNGGLQIDLTSPTTAVRRIEITWKASLVDTEKYLGDAWERSYGELQWKPLDPARVMPWYFLATDGPLTHGYGVMTGPGAMCFWKADTQSITLVADVRCGGAGVELGQRRLNVCTVVGREGKAGENPFTAGQEFCRVMCPHPRLAKTPIYGFNDWNCTYGKSTADKFIRDAGVVAELSPKEGPRPYLTVDDGWEANSQGGKSPSDPWDRTNAKFGSSMKELADRIKSLNTKPGLWYRPLLAWPDAPADWRLPRDKTYLDPTVPAVQKQIATDVSRFREWGYLLLKHDFSTYDLTGRWGFKMGDSLTKDGWAFSDRSHTTAEVILSLYRNIRTAAGDDMVIDGCNTITHLSAGIFDAQRVGDDTSGRKWADTRRNGINCLGFRAIQQGTFYTIDPDCVGLATETAIPWDLNRQWLELESKSGTMLTVSWPRAFVGEDQKKAITDALAASAKGPSAGEPLDWMTTKTPTRWRLMNTEFTFSW